MRYAPSKARGHGTEIVWPAATVNSTRTVSSPISCGNHNHVLGEVTLTLGGSVMARRVASFPSGWR